MISGTKQKEFAEAKAAFAAWEEEDERRRRLEQRQRWEAERPDWQPADGPEEDGE